MTAQSLASPMISFGRVTIPVDLYTATPSSERIACNLLHRKDGVRVLTAALKTSLNRGYDTLRPRRGTQHVERKPAARRSSRA